MDNHFLNRERFEILLNKLFENIDENTIIPQRLVTFENSLLKTVEKTASLNVWPLEHFLCAPVGFTITEKLRAKRKLEKNPNDLNNPVEHYKVLNTPDDVKQVAGEILDDFDSTVKLFESSITAGKITRLAPPVQWLELAQQTEAMTLGTSDNSRQLIGKNNLFIPTIIEKIIFYAYYNLDIETASDGVLLAPRCRAQDAARILGVNKDNLIIECLKNNYGVYIKKDLFKLKRFCGYPMTRSKIEFNAKTSYNYFHSGLVRLLDGVLDHFISGESISCAQGQAYKIVHLQPSLSECAARITAMNLELMPRQKIEIDDLIFIVDELNHKSEDLPVTPVASTALPKEITQTSHPQASLEATDLSSKIEIQPICIISKLDDCYQITYQDEKLIFKSSKGLVYLEHLVNKPRVDIHVNELESLINKQLLSRISETDAISENLYIDDGKSSELEADEKTIKVVRDALIKCKEDIEIAKEIGDTERLEELAETMAQLKAYLSRVTGLSGKPRKKPTANEKSRKRVFSAIHSALNKLKNRHFPLYDHLFATIITGEYCCYKPFEESLTSATA
jgi:hypothetical protein